MGEYAGIDGRNSRSTTADAERNHADLLVDSAAWPRFAHQWSTIIALAHVLALFPGANRIWRQGYVGSESFDAIGVCPQWNMNLLEYVGVSEGGFRLPSPAGRNARSSSAVSVHSLVGVVVGQTHWTDVDGRGYLLTELQKRDIVEMVSEVKLGMNHNSTNINVFEREDFLSNGIIELAESESNHVRQLFEAGNATCRR